MITNPFQGKAYDAVFVPMRDHEAASIRRCWSTWNVLCCERTAHRILRYVSYGELR